MKEVGSMIRISQYNFNCNFEIINGLFYQKQTFFPNVHNRVLCRLTHLFKQSLKITNYFVYAIEYFLIDQDNNCKVKPDIIIGSVKYFVVNGPPERKRQLCCTA